MKTPLFRAYIDLFRGKKIIIHNKQWRERKDIISRGRYGISPTDVIKESFCSSLQRIGEDGFRGFLKRKNVMACQYWITLSPRIIFIFPARWDFASSTCVNDDDRDVIPNSIKLIAGRTGQEYNQRKSRKGAFWEDRYHATAIEKGYLSLNCTWKP